jgi:hypothetical protein
MNKIKTVIALGLLVMTSTATAEKTTEVPIIIHDECSMQYDETEVMRCHVHYSDGTNEYYYVKGDYIYWHYPINNRVPSGGIYKPSK